MFRHLARSAAAAGVLAAALGFAPAAQATAPVVLASVDDCIDLAVANGGNEHLAAFACHEVNLTDCYRIFRDNYGPQQWALDACKLRTA
ncbi:hypothetical protein SAMN02982929_04106 [Saccharopolyspora kobensis]|uniref:Uncharacterized protein n=1 Tax=Saccharopolyspora kobensis TaxID=146035 RepID=A0A1H6DAI1_9PSEU|nr:hypothetical protein [Saccharopolyspora kobensis]SEG82467.1 hypothetical protein SAMN02982929_04106 [Saccharopolyspora kobensis]SFE24652.1 hypothetical protein SAMN05216506_11023 [Saccharopolyspora kobensis]